MYDFPVFKVSVNEVLGQVVPPGYICISKSGWKFTYLYQENDILTLSFFCTGKDPGVIKNVQTLVSPITLLRLSLFHVSAINSYAFDNKPQKRK